MRAFARDVKYAFRQLARQPAFAAAAILSLALGIGLNTTLFSVVNGVLLRDTGIKEPERLVEIYSGLSRDYPQLTTSYPDFLDIQASTDALAGVTANAFVRGILATDGRPVLVTGEAVTANYFDLLGLRPSIGRGFRDDENVAPGAVPVAVLSHGLWQQRFGGRADIVGRAVRLSGVEYTVVGVSRAGFAGTLPGIPTDVWVPLMMVTRLEFSGVQTSTDNDPGTTRLDRRGTRWLFVKGRLTEGRTVEDARVQIETSFARLRASYPVTNENVTASVVPAASVRFHPMLDGYIRAASAVLLAAVSLVLVIACANVANMLLARGASRQRDLAIRAAIGASRGRLMRQLLTESLVLAAIGGAAGLAIAWWSSRALSGVGANVFPMRIAFDFAIDGTVLTFALAASLATALLAGLAPAWSSAKPDLVPALKQLPESGRRPRVSISDALVVGQLALSLILLVAGTLLARGFLAAQRTDIGWDPRPVSSLSFNLQMNGYDTARGEILCAQALAAVRALPGVVAASTATRLPLAPDIMIEGVHVPGHHRPEDQPAPIDTVAVGPDYFATVDIPIVRGRAFTEADVTQQRKVAIVNETMARMYWSVDTAVGQRLYTAGFASTPLEILGVARDHKVRSVGESPRPYLHMIDRPARSIGLIVRTTMSAADALPMLRDAIWRLEPQIVFTEDAPAEQVAATTVAPTRLGALVLGGFGALALLLAGVGLYGVVAYSVSRRTREVGIRMALGASRAQVLRLILARGGVLAAVGVAVGTLVAAAVSRVLEALLYGVSSVDPLAYSVAAIVLLLVAALGNLIPAASAARVDPVRALRTE
jgi:predicted permease